MRSVELPEQVDWHAEDVLETCMRHNFWTWSAQAKVEPLPVKRAHGVYFWDYDDKRYLDFNSMVMCVNIGHGDRRVIEAIQQQAERLSFAGPHMATQPRAELCALLKAITPGDLDRFLFTLGGAEAIENAIKIARAATGRHKILARYRSYHGATHGAIAATGDPRRWVWEPNVMPGVVHFFGPYRYRSELHRGQNEVHEDQLTRDYLGHLEQVITFEGPETVAAILLETITGTNGVLIPPDGYLQGVREICDRFGILLILDEVMSGFGRSGAWFAADHWDVVPDLMVMAKGLTSAYAPLGAVAIREPLARMFNDRVYQGGLTFNGHPLSLAAAIANIRVLAEDRLVERSSTLDGVLKGHLAVLRDHHPCIGDVRSKGLFGAIELVRDRETKEPLSPFGSSSDEMVTLKRFCLDKGLYLVTHWHKILILPPLIINEDQLEEGFGILDNALDLIDQSLSS